MAKGFWTLIEELGPSTPEGGDVEWSASVATISTWLKSKGLSVTHEQIQKELDAAGTNYPNWTLSVERDGGRYRFSQVK